MTFSFKRGLQLGGLAVLITVSLVVLPIILWGRYGPDSCYRYPSEQYSLNVVLNDSVTYRDIPEIISVLQDSYQVNVMPESFYTYHPDIGVTDMVVKHRKEAGEEELDIIFNEIRDKLTSDPRVESFEFPHKVFRYSHPIHIEITAEDYDAFVRDHPEITSLEGLGVGRLINGIKLDDSYHPSSNPMYFVPTALTDVVSIVKRAVNIYTNSYTQDFVKLVYLIEPGRSVAVDGINREIARTIAQHIKTEAESSGENVETIMGRYNVELKTDFRITKDFIDRLSKEPFVKSWWRSPRLECPPPPIQPR